jgi:hypothetical protein
VRDCDPAVPLLRFDGATHDLHVWLDTENGFCKRRFSDCFSVLREEGAGEHDDSLLRLDRKKCISRTRHSAFEQQFIRLRVNRDHFASKRCARVPELASHARPFKDALRCG